MAYPDDYPSQSPQPYRGNYPPQGGTPYQDQGVHQPTQGYTLTRDEKRVLKECSQESFYRRCVPFMTALGLGAYYGIHLGYLKGHPIYGARPKVMTGLVIGFIAGKMSYRSQCEEKILRLPGGQLKESVLMSRKSPDKLWSGSLDDSGVYKDASIAYALPPYASVPFRSNEQSTASELDTERHHDTFDDSFRIRSSDNSGVSDPDDLISLVPPSQSTSYAELRLKNREEYEARRKQFRPGSGDDYSAAYSHVPPPNDRFSRADAYQSPTAAADRSSQSNVFQTYQAPNERFDNYSQRSDERSPIEQNTSIQPRSQVQRKNFYGDVIEK